MFQASPSGSIGSTERAKPLLSNSGLMLYVPPLGTPGGSGLGTTS